MTKHTEGTWIAYAPNDGENMSDFWEIHDPYGRTATVYGEEGSEAEHNARLIAAAPDLLAELRACLAELEHATGYDRQDTIRAAIAKATQP